VLVLLLANDCPELLLVVLFASATKKDADWAIDNAEAAAATAASAAAPTGATPAAVVAAALAAVNTAAAAFAAACAAAAGAALKSGEQASKRSGRCVGLTKFEVAYKVAAMSLTLDSICFVLIIQCGGSFKGEVFIPSRIFSETLEFNKLGVGMEWARDNILMMIRVSDKRSEGET
jgi:hypothetical protein